MKGTAFQEGFLDAPQPPPPSAPQAFCGKRAEGMKKEICILALIEPLTPFSFFPCPSSAFFEHMIAMLPWVTSDAILGGVHEIRHLPGGHVMQPEIGHRRQFGVKSPHRLAQ